MPDENRFGANMFGTIAIWGGPEWDSARPGQPQVRMADLTNWRLFVRSKVVVLLRNRALVDRKERALPSRFGLSLVLDVDRYLPPTNMERCLEGWQRHGFEGPWEQVGNAIPSG